METTSQDRQVQREGKIDVAKQMEARNSCCRGLALVHVDVCGCGYGTEI